MANTTEVRYLLPGQGRSIWWLGGRATFLATGEDTRGAFTLWQDTPPPGGGPIPHVHTREEEFFYVLGGEPTYQTAGQSFPASPGAFIGLPKGVPHSFRNGPAPARLLVFASPAGNEGFFLELGVPDSEADDPTIEPDLVRFQETAAKYGMTLLDPAGDWSRAILPLGKDRAPILLPPDEGERLSAAGVTCTIKADGPQTAGAYALLEMELAPGSRSPHKEEKYEVGVYVLEGTPTLRFGERTIRACADGFVSIPAGREYTVQNLSPYPVRLLLMAVPAGMEDHLREACAPRQGQ